jgi:serine/threonine protein kinase
MAMNQPHDRDAPASAAMSPSNEHAKSSAATAAVIPIRPSGAPTEIESARVILEPTGTGVRIGLHLDVEGLPGRTADYGRGGADSRYGRGAREGNDVGPGFVVADRYELRRVLGRGSMGAVWLASDRALGEEVAVKLLTPAPGLGGVENASTAAARFRFEAQVAARLARKTRHVVRVTDHGYDGDRAFLVMERLEGQTLERALASHGPMAPADVAALVTQIARGLDAAHAEGVLHRDLKPSNVFLSTDEDGGLLVKLLDFGIARRDRASGVDTRFATANGVLFGTPGYMSPEQANIAPDLDGRADLWALAAIAYEALTGELPVEGHDTEQMLANLRAGRIVPLSPPTASRAARRGPESALPEACLAFFVRAFAPQIEARFATSGELALAFEEAAGKSRVRSGTLALRTQRLAHAPHAQRASAGAVIAPRRAPRRAGVLLACAATALAVAGFWVAVALHPRAAGAESSAELRAPSPPSASEAPPVEPARAPAADPIPPAPGPSEATATSKPAPAAATDYGEFKTHF